MVSSSTRRGLWLERLRRVPSDPYAWAMARRTVGGKQLIHLPALQDIARDRHPFIVIQKSAQVGISELLIDIALWAADAGHAGRGNVLFLMPTQNQMDDFAQGRIDRAIQESPYLRGRLQPEPPRRKGADSKRLKRVGPGYIYLRGAESRRQIASVDADVVILDEYDQMEEGILDLARKRLASSRDGRLFVASTPRLPEAGVNELYLASDQRRYFLRCARCRLEQSLAWAENVDLEQAGLVCRSCRHLIEIIQQGRWMAEAPGSSAIHGYHLSRLYAPWADIPSMITSSRATTPLVLQEFFNSDLGEAFAPPGGGATLDTIDRCRRDYVLSDYAGQECDMGADVGLRLHVVVRERLGYERPRLGVAAARLWFAGEVASFVELEALMARYRIRMAVVDSMPEMHAAAEFAIRHKDRVWLAHYREQPGYERTRGKYGEPNRFHVNRVEALEATFQRFRDGAVELPRDARRLSGPIRDGLGEYYRQLMVPKRVLERDRHGNWTSRWVNQNRDDHYAHAEVYCMLAGTVRGARLARAFMF